MIRKTNEERQRCIELLEQLGMGRQEVEAAPGDAEMTERGKDNDATATQEAASAGDDTTAAAQGTEGR